MKTSRPFLLLIAISLSIGCATADDPRRGDWLEVLEGTTRVTCRGADLEGPLGPRLARSDVFVSPDGSRMAWVEVEARALVDGSGGTCQNISRLYVRDAAGTRVVFLQKPGWEGRNGNALEIIDWSADGNRIVMELFTWTYPTDPMRPLALVWDAATGQTTQVDARLAVAERAGVDCELDLRARGFDAAGNPILSVGPREGCSAPSLPAVVAFDGGTRVEPLTSAIPPIRSSRRPASSVTAAR